MVPGKKDWIHFFLSLTEGPAFGILPPADLFSSVQPIYFCAGICPPVGNKSYSCYMWTLSKDTCYIVLSVSVCVWERERNKETKGDTQRTAILTIDLLTTLSFHNQRFTSSLMRSIQPGATVGHCPTRVPAGHSLALYRPFDCLTARLRLTVFLGYLCMYFIMPLLRSSSCDSRVLLPLVYTSASYAKKSLTDGSVKDQYATRVFSQSISCWKQCLIYH